MQQTFVHLRLHTEYSLVDGLIRIKPLMKALPALGMNAVAITDFCNLFSVIKVFQAAVAQGIKPIFGCDLPYIYPEKPNVIYSMILLCQNDIGYRNLTRLVSKAYLEGQHLGKPRAHADWIAEHAEGLIALSGGRMGDIGQALLQDNDEKAQALATRWKTHFPDRFYLEIQRTDRKDEAIYNEKAIKLAENLELPLVATHDVCFMEEADYEAHEARVCIHEGVTLADPKRVRRYSPKQYLQSSEEMQQRFADLPDALQNTVEIAKRCTVKLNLGKNYLPNFPTPAGTSIEAYLSQLAQTGLKDRLGDANEVYQQRLEVELAVINSMGFAGYFLIVADFIKWAKENGVPVGPGRGSGAGSLVAYVLHITDIDPLPYDLLFERFLNPERVSMPDFDIDFCMEGRDRVIDYVSEKYGRQSVSQIITFGTMAAKAVVRDVGRVLAHPYGFVDELAKLIPFELGMTLTTAMQQEEALRQRYEQEEDVKELFDLAFKLEGITRNAGKHAGGVVIAPSQLTDFTALYCEEGSNQWVSQFDKDDVEAAGLVKFDFLGLRTLTIIDWAVKIVNENHQKKGLPFIDIAKIPTDDPLSFQLLKACQTTAVFQLESRGMKELIHRLLPDCFEDIIALVALFRPGPLQSGMVDDFIERKHGLAQISYPHPDLEPILKPTYGVILYQEQVMQIAQVLANYTLGAADLLRRAMGKKKPEEMAKQRAFFTEGASQRGVDSQVATTIFDLMEKFAGYGFNKSHSAAYALVAYQTAWLKAHYPAAFMAAVLSSDMDNTDKVVIFLDECKRMNLQVLSPSIHDSFYSFTVGEDNRIVYGLGAIKGVGEAAIESLIAERETSGPFTSLFDLCRRVDLRKLNRRVLEVLIKSGAMDGWGVDRGILLASLEKAMREGILSHEKKVSGQLDFFELFDDIAQADAYCDAPPWPIHQRLQSEKETLGYYLTGHPADCYLDEWKGLVAPLSQLHPSPGQKRLICGEVISLRLVLTKRGKKLAIIGLEDAKAKIDLVVFSEIFEMYKNYVMVGKLLIAEGEVSRDDYSGGLKMMVAKLLSVEEMRTRFAKSVVLTLTLDDEKHLSTIQALLKAHTGHCAVQIHYLNHQAQGVVTLGKPWQVLPSDELITTLRALLDPTRVELRY